MEDIRLLVQEEGRTARNLVAYHVPLNHSSDSGKTLARKPPTSPRPAVESKKDEIALQRCCDSPKPGLRARSASTGRDKKSALQARYWAFIFENLKRAVTEIYLTCESDESESECKEAILVLENYTREFHNLIEWLKLKSNYESASPRQWPPSLAWGVRKSNMGQIRGMLGPNHLFSVVSPSSSSDTLVSHTLKPSSFEAALTSVCASVDLSGDGSSAALRNHTTDASETVSSTCTDNATTKTNNLQNSLMDTVKGKSELDRPITTKAKECSVEVIQTVPSNLALFDTDDTPGIECRAVGTQTQTQDSAQKQMSEKSSLVTIEVDKTVKTLIVTDNSTTESKTQGVCDTSNGESTQETNPNTEVEVVTLNEKVETLDDVDDERNKTSTTVKGSKRTECPSNQQGVISIENSSTNVFSEPCSFTNTTTLKIKKDQASQTDMELCVEEGSEAIRFVSPFDVCTIEGKEIVASPLPVVKQTKKPVATARPNYAAVSSLRHPPKLQRPSPKPLVSRSTTWSQAPSNYVRPNITSQPVLRPLISPSNSFSKMHAPQLTTLRSTAVPTSKPIINQIRLSSPLVNRPYARTPLLSNNRRGSPLETSPLARENVGSPTTSFLSRRVPSGLNRRSHSTLSSGSLHSTSSARSVHSTSSVRSWADKVKHSAAPATVSVEVLPRTGASSQDDDQGWETVKGRSRSRYSPSASRARLRFNQPSAASSLPALALSEVELCPHVVGNNVKKPQTVSLGKFKRPLVDANLQKKVGTDTIVVKKSVTDTNNMKKASGNPTGVVGEVGLVITKKSTGEPSPIRKTGGDTHTPIMKKAGTNLANTPLENANNSKKRLDVSNHNNKIEGNITNTDDENTTTMSENSHKPKTNHKKSPTHEKNTEKDSTGVNCSGADDFQIPRSTHKKSPTHARNTENDVSNINCAIDEDFHKSRRSSKESPTHTINTDRDLDGANCASAEDFHKSRTSHKKSPTHEKNNKEKSNTRERSKSKAKDDLDDRGVDTADIENEEKETTILKNDEKEESCDIHSDLESCLEPGYEDILQEGEQLSHEEAELRREIRELETTDIEVDTETEDDEAREERLELRRDSRSGGIEGESKVDLEKGEDDLVGGDNNEEIESLEARYETVLNDMTWAERMDTLEQLHEYVSRHPGRATELHQKLSSPSRRKTLAETLRKFQLKQAQAQEKREMMQRAKAQRLKDLHDRVAEVKVMQEANIAKSRVLLERKLKNAESRRNLHLKGIVRKAHDEEQKVKELAFITELEAQNKRIDFINQCQKQEVLVQGIYEERQRKLEEKAAKEAAVEERRRLLEAEWHEKIERMQEQRRVREERVGRAQQEKEKSRKEQAREKARDREERLSALHAAQMATVEELQKKIQQKQEESARRHEENMEHIRQRALESSILRTDDVAPRIHPYPVQKMCGVCHVLIGSEVYLLSHLRGRNHQEAVLKLHEGAGKEDIPMLNIRHIVDAPADKLDPRLALDKKRQAALKKRCKKIRQRMAVRGRDFENAHETPTDIDAPNKPRINKSLKDIEKLSSSQGKGQWPNNAITALERALGEINRILAKPRSEPDQTSFQSLSGFTTVANILSLGLDVPPNMAPYLPIKCFVTACTTLTLACKNHPCNSAYLLLSNKVTTVLDLLLSRLAVLLPGAAPGSNGGRLAADALGDALMRLLALVLSVAAPDSDQVSVRVQDVISYTVCVGVVDKLALYCGSVRDPIDGDPGLLLSGLDLLTTLTARCRSTKGDPTQLLVTLQLTELVGAVSMLYGMLLHQGAPPRDSPPAPLVPHATEVALATVTLLSRVAELDLNIFQSVLGAEGISLQFRHIASYLLWYCSHDHGNDELLHAVVRVVGFFAVNHRDNQMMLQSGYTPTVLQQLCSLPLDYFRVPMNGLLFPTLLACCAGNKENRAILEQEVCYESLEEFRRSDASCKNTLMQILASGSKTSAG